LVIEAITSVTDVVEAMHRQIDWLPRLLFRPKSGRTAGLTGLVYWSVRGVTRLVGAGLDLALAQLGDKLVALGDWPDRALVVAALNGVLGDHLEASGNPLATRMALCDRRGTQGGRILLLVHGSSMCERGWRRNGHDHGEALAADLGLSAVYL